jgi:hypothetical protein
VSDKLQYCNIIITIQGLQVVLSSHKEQTATFTATDEVGNSRLCSFFIVTVEDNTDPVVICMWMQP